MGKLVRIGYYAVAAVLAVPMAVASGGLAVGYRLAGCRVADTQADIDLRDHVRAEEEGEVDLRALEVRDS